MKLAVSFGGYYTTVDKYIKAAKYCESKKLHSIWLADSQMIHRDVYQCLALCARETSGIRLGTAVTNPITRDITVTACAMSTLNEISNGRAILGIGPGDSSVRRIGSAPSSVENLESSVKAIRRICRGETVTLKNGEKVSMRWSSTEIPVYLSATGDRMLELAGKACDGVIINVGVSDLALKHAIQRVKTGLDQRQRNSNFVFGDQSFMSVSDDREAAIQKARPYVIWYMKNAPKLFTLNSIPINRFTQELESVKSKYIEHDHIHTDEWSEALARSSFIKDEMVQKFAIAGTPEDCVRRLSEMERVGVELFMARHTGDDKDWESFLSMYCENILPHFS